MAALIVVTSAGLTGCTGSARLEVLSLNAAAIDPPPPETATYNATECYWWTQDDGTLAVAMVFDLTQFFSPIGPSKLKMSLILDGEPTGIARNYLLSGNHVRAVFRVGLQEDRFLATHGICAIKRAGDGQFNGSFRLWILHQPGPGLFDLFPRTPSQLLFQGTFTAVADKDGRGRSFLVETEDHGWDRASMSQPKAPAPTNVDVADEPTGPDEMKPIR